MLWDYPSGPSVLAATEKAAKESSSLGKSLNRVNSPLKSLRVISIVSDKGCVFMYPITQSELFKVQVS